jgi:NAD(P)-dependent dehydrogenase (short-subunit alcohol dehydrogenase family)
MARLNFEDKVVLITGGNSGIGLATAIAFARAGARVIISGRDQASIDRAVIEIGHGAHGLRSDAGEVRAAADLVSAVESRFGRIDVLFANAGVGVFLPIEEVTEQDWDECFSTNLKGAYFLAQKAVRIMPRGSAMIFNCSIGASYVGQGSTLYSASKAALRTVGRGLAVELAPRGIRVNIVSPGPTDTALPHRTRGIADVEKFKQLIATSTALGRVGRPEEIAASVLFLASEESSFILGSELIVDGGFLCMP